MTLVGGIFSLDPHLDGNQVPNTEYYVPPDHLIWSEKLPQNRHLTTISMHVQ